MKIGMMYAMDGEIESLLKNENAHLIEKVSGASFYQIRENIVACPPSCLSAATPPMWC